MEIFTSSDGGKYSKIASIFSLSLSQPNESCQTIGFFLYKTRLFWNNYNLFLPSMSMKRIISLLILVIYSLTTFGVGLQFHYCGKKISSIQVLFNDEHSCSCGKGEMKPDCCKNEIKYFKVKSVHSKSSTSSFPNYQFSLLLPKIFDVKTIISFSEYVHFSLDKPPPNLNRDPIYKRNLTFLI